MTTIIARTSFSLDKQPCVSWVQLFQVKKLFHQITGMVCVQVSILYPDVLQRRDGGFEVVENWRDRMLYDQSFSLMVARDPTSDLATSPLGLPLLQDLLALLPPAYIDRVTWIVDLKRVLVLHVGILDFSGLLIKLQNMGHPKSEGERWREFKEQQQRIH